MTHVIRVSSTRRRGRIFLFAVSIIAASTLVLSQARHGSETGIRETKIIGRDRLVSVEPLPEIDGQICESPPSEMINLVAEAVVPEPLRFPARQEAQTAAVATNAPRPTDAARTEIAHRQPASTLKDPRDAFAGLWVDPLRNEVVFAEENNSSVLVYDRMTSTPPGAAE